MALFGWLSRVLRHGPGDETEGLTQPPGHSGERSQRREQLYVIVREVMVQTGILSAGYKFKVLALDRTGQRFVVMIDLAPAYAADATQQRDIESCIAELAKARLDAGVHAVYWRINSLIRPVEGMPSMAAPVLAPQQPHLAGTEHSGWRPAFEPIEVKEMDAFKQAVAASAVATQKPRRWSARGPLLGPGSGREEGGEFSVSGLGSLGATQYGELR